MKQNHQIQNHSTAITPINEPLAICQVNNSPCLALRSPDGSIELRPLPAPVPLSPNVTAWWDNPLAIVAAGAGLMLLTGMISWAFMRLLFAPAPVPAPVPATPQPQTVIVQPPPVERKRHTSKDCRPSGLFGWNEACETKEWWE